MTNQATQKQTRQPQTAVARLEALTQRPRRPAPLHLGAAAISVVSFATLLVWMAGNHAKVSPVWAMLDTTACVLAAMEFATRSGWRWDRRGYLLTHIFDFIAIVPALLLVHADVLYAHWWAWVILAARSTRVADRLLGDGFVELSVARVIERFEEAVTDRVLLRLLRGVERGLEGGRLGQAAGAALTTHRESMLSRVRAARPPLDKGTWGQLLGLEQRVQEVEGRTFDAIVEVMSSPEVDRAMRDMLAAALTDLRAGISRQASPREGPSREGSADQEHSAGQSSGRGLGTRA